MSISFWSRVFDVAFVKRIHDRTLSGATEESFRNTLQNFDAFLGESDDANRADLEDLIERASDRQREVHRKALRALQAQYQRMLGDRYYKTRERLHLARTSALVASPSGAKGVTAPSCTRRTVCDSGCPRPRNSNRGSANALTSEP